MSVRMPGVIPIRLLESVSFQASESLVRLVTKSRIRDLSFIINV